MDSLPVHHRKTLSYSITIFSNSKDFIFQTLGGVGELSILLDMSFAPDAYLPSTLFEVMMGTFLISIFKKCL